VLASFEKSAHPFVLTPGDNDWTDCHLLKAQQVDPLERLEKLREECSSAKAEPWAEDDAGREPGEGCGLRRNSAKTSPGRRPAFVFATFHTVGSNDNKGRTPEMDTEQAEREAANIAWLKKAFAAARQSNAPGLVLITQANVNFENHWTPSLKGRYVRSVEGSQPPKEQAASAYDSYVNALADEMENYDRPVLFIHGDTHLFRINKPLLSKKTKRFFENFTRLEVFGDPESHWVRVTVDPAKAVLFVIEPEIVAENKAN
jgi:hypothetical protein